MLLGDILVDEALLARTQLEQAQRIAERSGKPLISVLLEQDLVTEDALVAALVHHLKLDVFDLPQTDVNLDAVAQVPHNEAVRHRLLPLQIVRRNGRKIMSVVMANPLDLHAREEIEFLTGCRIEPIIGRASDVTEAIRLYYRALPKSSVVPRAPLLNPRRDSPIQSEPKTVGSTKVKVPIKNTKATPGWSQTEGRLMAGRTKIASAPRASELRTDTLNAMKALAALLIDKGIITAEELAQRISSLKKNG